VKVLITGGSGGLGRAFAAALPDAEIVSLDLTDGFDVGNASAWRERCGRTSTGSCSGRASWPRV
jgi:nucleoside-diphosphate-sugar epimerase